MNTPRMRTAAGVLQEIKAMDPSTEVTFNYIRYLIHTEAVPVLCVGRKKLVNVDAVLAYLDAGSQPEPPALGEIRPVAVR